MTGANFRCKFHKGIFPTNDTHMHFAWLFSNFHIISSTFWKSLAARCVWNFLWRFFFASWFRRRSFLKKIWLLLTHPWVFFSKISLQHWKYFTLITFPAVTVFKLVLIDTVKRRHRARLLCQNYHSNCRAHKVIFTVRTLHQSHALFQSLCILWYRFFSCISSCSFTLKSKVICMA